MHRQVFDEQEVSLKDDVLDVAPECDHIDAAFLKFKLSDLFWLDGIVRDVGQLLGS